MSRNFLTFIKQSLTNFFEAYINLIVFFAYFFSVLSLLKTLFYPWKNITSFKKTVGFSLSLWFDRLMIDFISRSIGFTMRLSLLAFYILIEFTFLLILPVVFILYLVLIPILYLTKLTDKTPEDREKIYIENFVSTHLLEVHNRQAVTDWAKLRYRKLFKQLPWWKLSRLTQYPPLARDWASGFTPTLDEYAIDLTSAVYQLKRPNIIDREKEIDQLERALSTHSGGNVLIVGEEGVGKHTIVDALAKKIYIGNTLPSLMYKRILKLNMEAILTKFTDSLQRENFFEGLLKEGNAAGNVILFIENIHKYIGGASGYPDLSTVIAKYAKSPNLDVIGMTTPYLFQKLMSGNDQIVSLFTKIDVAEIAKDEALIILLSHAQLFEDRYHITIPYEVITAVIDKSTYYITYIPFPEKAIEILDATCIYASQKGVKLTPPVVDAVLEEKLHVKTHLTPELNDTLLNLERLMKTKILGQNDAVSEIAKTLRRSFILIGKRKNPLTTLLFFGPTGVGKTLTAKTLASIFFGNEERLIRFDMSAFQQIEDIAKLLGSSESGEPGLLSSQVREKPYAVLLLDEIEKANHRLLNIFLTLLDEGYITDGFGKKVDCKNLIVVATTNSKLDSFRPEFLNRFDGLISFKPISIESAIEIAHELIKNIEKTVNDIYKVRISLSDEFVRSTVASSVNVNFGIRDLERVLRSSVEDQIAKRVLENKIKEGDTVAL